MPGKGDVLHRLPLLEWRGLSAPCQAAPLEGSHRQSQRVVAYIDGWGHDHTGRDGYRMDARLFFVETIKKDDFTVLLKQWLAAVEDGTSGKFVHPVRGPMRARVIRWKLDVNAGNRGGAIMDVSWEETIDDFDAVSTLAAVNISPSALGAAAQAAASEYNVNYPDGQPETSLTEGIAAIDGAVTSLSLSVTGKLNQVMGSITDMVDRVDDLDDHEAYPAWDNLVMLWAQLEDTSERIESIVARPVGKRELQHPSTLDAFADATGNTIDEIMGLNLQHLNRPRLPAGTVLSYYTS